MTIPTLGGPSDYKRASGALKVWARWREDSSFPIYIITLLVVVLAGIYSPTFRKPYNLSNIAVQLIPLGLAGLGQTFAILVGDVDLCIGGLISLTTVLSAMLMRDNFFTVVGVAILCLTLGGVVGMINGILATRLRMDAMVITFATNSIIMGIALYLMPAPGGMIPYSYMKLTDLVLWGIPVPLIGLILLTVMSNYLLNRTTLGLHIRAVGGNRTAAFRSGIEIMNTKVWAHIVGCLFGAMAGLFLAARMGSGDPLAGTPFSLDSMTAVIAGGTNFATGIGDVAGTLVAAFLITVLGNILNHLGISMYFQYVFKGLLLLVAVAGGAIRRKMQLNTRR